jgi:hypothetical protein
MGKRLDTKTFIERANHIHGDEYNYSLVDYKNNKTKVKIVCKKHGTFEQLPINHIESKSGCNKCYGNNKITTEEFIQRSKLKHDNNYDYSLVDYKTDKLKVKIICKKHGIFEQTPNVHLNGHGCFKCGNKNDLETFLEKSKLIYGDLYDYSLVDYVNINTSIKVICKKHGDFKILPSTFLYEKKGCIHCNGTYKNIDLFLEDARKIHGDKYKYEVIDNLYKNSFIKIICPNHGEFRQKIRSHIYDGCGCISCFESKGEKIISEYLKNREIKFIRQHQFEKCKNKYKLSFDFYLPDYNLCIEYDGIQHFNPVKYFGGQSKFEKIRINDRIKDDYCSQNNIRLIRISYSDNIFESLCNLPI